MIPRIAATHLIFLALAAIATGYVAWSSVAASSRFDNLVVVVPAAVALAILITFILAQTLLRKSEASGGEDAPKDHSATIADLILLAVFAVFCLALTTTGFDIATFLFVWAGIVLGGERRWWIPPLFSAAFTFLLIFGLGALFPFPMPMLVL